MSIEFRSNTDGRVLILMLALATIAFFGLGGAALITMVQERDLAHVILPSGDAWSFISLGAIGGSLIGLMAWVLITRPAMKGVLRKYAGLIGSIGTTLPDRITISVCAGIGEELFFRGAIQHWLGIVATAILFVAIHGYLDPRDRHLMIYGVFMTLVMVLFGWVARQYGLMAPMAAHTVVDIVLLELLHRKGLQLAHQDRPEQGL